MHVKHVTPPIRYAARLYTRTSRYRSLYLNLACFTSREGKAQRSNTSHDKTPCFSRDTVPSKVQHWPESFLYKMFFFFNLLVDRAPSVFVKLEVYTTSKDLASVDPLCLTNIPHTHTQPWHTLQTHTPPHTQPLHTLHTPFKHTQPLHTLHTHTHTHPHHTHSPNTPFTHTPHTPHRHTPYTPFTHTPHTHTPYTPCTHTPHTPYTPCTHTPHTPYTHTPSGKSFSSSYFSFGKFLLLNSYFLYTVYVLPVNENFYL